VLGLSAYAIWLLCTLAEASVVVCSLVRGSFRKYLALNLYMIGSVVVSVLRYWVFASYGYASDQYAFCYYYSDVLLTICLYFALTNLYAHVFEEMAAEKNIRFSAILLLVGTAAFSLAIVLQSSHRFTTRFFVEVSQNLNFVGLVLTYILWGAVFKLRETRTQLIQLVLALGLYFSLFAASFALRNLYPPASDLLKNMDPIIGCVLPLTWAYAFWRVPSDARLRPAGLAVVPR